MHNYTVSTNIKMAGGVCTLNYIPLAETSNFSFPSYLHPKFKSVKANKTLTKTITTNQHDCIKSLSLHKLLRPF